LLLTHVNTEQCGSPKIGNQSFDRRIVTKFASFILGLTLSFSGDPNIAADAPTPDVIVNAVVNETLSIVKQDKDVLGGKLDRLVTFTEFKVLPLFDFVLMTRSILGRSYWAQSTPVQQEALIREFRTLTLNTYVAAYTSYKDFAIEYKPLRMAPTDNEVTVKTLIRLPNGAEPVTLDFYFHKSPNGWEVFDIDVAGHSMVLARRGELAAILRDGGIDAAIKLLSDQNSSKGARR